MGVGLIPVRGAKVPHVSGQLSPHAATREAPLHLNKDPEQPKLFFFKGKNMGEWKGQSEVKLETSK